jgi:hypothetical protein
MAGTTGLEPATSDVTGRRSNQLNYVPAGGLLDVNTRLYRTKLYDPALLKATALLLPLKFQI